MFTVFALLISLFVGVLSIATQRYILNQLSKKDQKKVIFIYGFGTMIGVYVAIVVMMRLKLPINGFSEFILQIIIVLVLAVVLGKVMYKLAPKAYKDIKQKEINEKK